METDILHLDSLRNINVRKVKNGFVVALVDNQGFEIVNGYGECPTSAMNDLLRNLI